jgi:hypothetical protein
MPTKMLAAGEHMTEKLSFEEVSSSMVQLGTLKLKFLSLLMMGFLSCLMGDVNHACIQANINELVHAVAGPELVQHKDV